MYDVVVIGSGPAGYVAALRAAKNGLKTAVVEKYETFGGTCLNVGCIPSKALLHYSHHSPNMEVAKMMEKKLAVVDSLVSGVDGLFTRNKVTKLRGTARFLDSGTIEVNGEKVSARSFVLAAGSKPIELPFLPFDGKRVVSSTGALSFAKPPKRLLVIGAGVIGLELASVWSRLGSEVTIIELLDTILPGTDHEVAKLLQRALQKQGMTFHLSAKVQAAKVEELVTLTVEKGGKEESFAGDAVLVAVGRRPYADLLDLGKTKVTLSDRGFVQVNEHFQTKDPAIYAIGDLIEGPMLAHKAVEEGVVVADLLAGKNAEVDYISIPNVVYTFPEVATVGLTEKECKARGITPLKGVANMLGNARARAMEATEGMVKILAHPETRRLLGLHIVAPVASEMISEGSLALRLRARVDDLVHTCHPHPTLSEAVWEAACDTVGQAIHK